MGSSPRCRRWGLCGDPAPTQGRELRPRPGPCGEWGDSGACAESGGRVAGRGSPRVVCGLLLQKRAPCPGCSWHPALPPSSTDPRGVAGPGNMGPAVGGRLPGDWARGLSGQGSPAVQEARPAAAGSLGASQAGRPASVAPGAPCPWPRALDPHLPAQGLGGGLWLCPQVAAHRACESGRSPCLSLDPSQP